MELTESVLMGDAESSNTTLSALKATGISPVVDDFCTGYSNFSYLNRFPIDTLKIDHSFVRDVQPSPINANITSGGIGMRHGVNLRVVAGGIETREQCAVLRNVNCDEGQDFYRASFQSAPDFGKLLAG